MQKYISYISGSAVASTFAGGVGYWAYDRRKSTLTHPVMRRALLELQKDQRVHDFCGENLRPGFSVSVTETPTENYIKFGFTIKGSSGDLGATVIADYLTHRELTILEAERSDYFGQRTQLKGQMAKVARDKKKSEETEL
jgi:hypothetical protein